VGWHDDDSQVPIGDDDSGDDDGGDDDTSGGGDDDAGDDDDDTGDVPGGQPPSAPMVLIQPQVPGPGEELACEILAPSVDPEGATVTYVFSWQVDGTPTGFVAAVVPPGIVEAGQQWSCAVIPSDGHQTGETNADQVTVAEQPPAFFHVQQLAGGPSSIPCEDCDFAFDVTFSTLATQGECTYCLAFDDGVQSLGYMSTYEIIALYLDYPPYLGWYVWYYTSSTGNRIDFTWNGDGYSQYGYWDVTLPSMTGRSFNLE